MHELTAVSAEARYWLLGFLTGCEPDLAEYLGYRASDNYAYTDEDLVRWHDFLARHRIQGYFPYLNRHPNRALVITDEERAEIHLDDWRPWTYVSERVLVPDGAEWVEADPQPQMDGNVIAGSVCTERGHHALMWLKSGWTVCCDCGEATMDWDSDNDYRGDSGRDAGRGGFSVARTSHVRVSRSRARQEVEASIGEGGAREPRRVRGL